MFTDGVQDGGAEVGIGRVTVTLRDPSNVVLASTLTDSDGLYAFSSLQTGVSIPPTTANYQLVVDTAQPIVAELTPTESDSTSATPTTDSDGVFDFVAQSSTIVFTTPASGVTDIQHDFGYVYLLAIN
jgi:hypothetical protein